MGNRPMLAVEPAYFSVLALVALTLGICAVWALRMRRNQPTISSEIQSFSSNPKPITKVVEATNSALRRRQPLQIDPCVRLDTLRPADESDPLQRCFQSLFRCSCLKQVDAHVAPFASKSPPLAMPPAVPPLGPSTEALSPEAAARLTSELCSVYDSLELRDSEPDVAHEIEQISQDIEWLQCFWAVSNHDVETATALVRAYASSSQAFKMDEPQVAEILSAGLIDILPGGSDDCAVVAVVRDIQIIGRLLQAHSFRHLVAAHLVQLERLLRSSARARQHGVSMVHDLSGLNWTLVRSMLDPINLHMQLRATHFLFTAFPVRFDTIVVVDAPPAFGMLLNAVQAVAPGAIPEPLQFVSRPEAVAHCARVFRQSVL